MLGPTRSRIGASPASLRYATVLAAAALCMAAGSADASPRGKVAQGSFPYGSAEMDGIVYFTAADDAHGRELWRTDGTASGTWLVKDLLAGSQSSNPCNLTGIGGALYFGTEDAANARFTLWISDGTSAGTVALRQFPGLGSCWDFVHDYGGPDAFTGAAGMVFFSATDDYGRDLWRTDGTPQGTVVVRDLAACLLGADPRSLTAFDDRVYFTAQDCQGRGLWRSDGTAAGTVRAWKDEPDPSWEALFPLAVVGDALLFPAYNNRAGYQQWVTDGVGAGVLKDAVRLSSLDLGDSDYIASSGGLAFFFATAPSDEQSERAPFEVWRTDGTGAGTVAVGRFRSASGGALPRAFAILGDDFYFAQPRSGVVDPDPDGGLWKASSDGVEKLQTLGEWFTAETGGLVASGAQLFLLGREVIGQERVCSLWVSRGTAAQTARLTDHAGCLGGWWDPDEPVSWIQPFRQGVLFGGRDPDAGYELFFSDGTVAGTRLVADLNPAVACPGDCDDSGAVTVDELIRAVAAGLGRAGVPCGSLDADANRRLSVEEIVAAVGRALDGC